MAKKILLTFLTLNILAIFNNVFANEYTHYMPKGSLVQVYSKIPITTEQLEEGSKVYFIAPSDVWVVEKKAISRGDIFQGYVSMLKMPTQGINAAMSIAITDIINPKTKEKTPIKGRIIFMGGSDVLGGNLAPPASYNTTIHPRKVYGNIWGGTLQYVPSGEYEFGRHVRIIQRDSVFVQFDEDYYI
ncbi:MAG: hypothetical protein IJB79_00435 [Candidatus Gastranaerophilales bacterium]|nr:hypothetical protein [Candidatus Gastranaerophilales bacterium]